MNIRNFKAGKYFQRYENKSFEPEFINHQWTWDDPEINILFGEANKTLGELNAFSNIVPDIDLFIAMHILKEATTSSKIEGTKTDIDEALLDINEISPEKRDDWQEVQNYIKAINFAIDELKNIPLSNRLIKNTHKILLKDSRGKHKAPGEYRKSQNWIGGNNIKNALYIPPHFENIDGLMSDLEKFIHNENIFVPDLIKIAIIHYQFETIHPFLDGNGRIGRLLITLFLVSKSILSKPSLYISDYLEKNRAVYYDSLTLVRKKNDLTQWIKFFLNAIYSTADKGITTFSKILELKNKLDKTITTMGRKSENARLLLYRLYKNPIIDVKNASDLLKISERTARELIKDFEKNKILIETTGLSRNRNYAFKEYIQLFYE